jgi:hypothetical protein
MTKARLDGLYLVVLGALVFVLMGSALETVAPVSTVDFRVVYYSARCLLDHRDPYNSSELDNIYRTEGGESARDSAQIKRSERRYNYLPTAFLITLPFAILPFGPAHIIWLLFTASCVLLASYLIWDIGACFAPTLSGGLVCLSLATSELFLILGNPAGIAVSLCAIATWCFVKRRLISVGILCFALSLMLKPHDSGLIWLYFLLAGGVYRRRAWQTAAAVFVLSLPVVLWVTYVTPNWFHEFRTTLLGYSSPGDVNDPGPTSMASHGIGMVINLQTVFSVFRDDPGFYNPITYVLCGALLITWIVLTLRSRPTETIAWFALAPMTALSMLPIYHRVYDAKLLLLAIPACCILGQRGGAFSRIIVISVALALILTGAMPWAIFLSLLSHTKLPPWLASFKIMEVLQMFPVPLILLLVGILLLLAYAHSLNGQPQRRLVEGKNMTV